MESCIIFHFQLLAACYSMAMKLTNVCVRKTASSISVGFYSDRTCFVEVKRGINFIRGTWLSKPKITWLSEGNADQTAAIGSALILLLASKVATAMMISAEPLDFDISTFPVLDRRIKSMGAGVTVQDFRKKPPTV